MPPGIDGVETIAKIWKMDLNIQAVICTAYSKYSWVDLQKVFGDSERLFVLKKPFDNIEVIQLAIALTRRWNINSAIRQQLAIVNSLPTDPKSDKGRAEGFNRLKESIENLARLTSKMKGPS
jgi:DNA-binding LytR/AlgR family response regulator